MRIFRSSMAAGRKGAAAGLFSTLMVALALTPLPASAGELAGPDVRYVPGCVALAQEHGLDTDRCAVTTGLALGPTRSTTVSEVLADTSVSASQRSALVAAAAAGTIRSRTYNQWVTGVAYTRTQKGTWYYNGSRSWVTQTYSGKTGSHTCYTSYAVGP